MCLSLTHDAFDKSTGLGPIAELYTVPNNVTSVIFLIHLDLSLYWQNDNRQTQVKL